MNTDGNTDAINRHLAEREGAPSQRPIRVVANLQAFLDDNSLPRDEHDAMAEAADRIEKLEANLAKVTAERDGYKARGDNHWETLRSIRHIATTSGDLERISQWVSDAGTGYTETAETTLSKQMDRAKTAEVQLAKVTAERDDALRAVDENWITHQQVIADRKRAEAAEALK